jgi:hypothetical protein
MRNFVFLLFILFTNITFSQNNLQLKRVVKTDSFNFEVFVSEKRNQQFKHNDSLYYHWFKSQKIFRTQGGSEGEIIHGDFRKFYLSGQLAEKGYLHFGLKHGTFQQTIQMLRLPISLLCQIFPTQMTG